MNWIEADQVRLGEVRRSKVWLLSLITPPPAAARSTSCFSGDCAVTRAAAQDSRKASARRMMDYGQELCSDGTTCPGRVGVTR